MKKIAFFTSFVLFLAVAGLGAQTLSIDYVDGYLDILEEGSWREAYIGDTLKPGDTIRLDSDSYAEIKGGNIALTLTDEGTYRISELLSARDEDKKLGLGSLVAGRLTNILQDDGPQNQSTVGGVRASEGSTGDEMDWYESDTAQLILASREMISEGDLDEALSALEEAYDLALDEQEETETRFYQGYVYDLKGETAKAIEFLTAAEPNTYSRNYHSHVLVAGNLMLNSFAYDKAQEWFADYSPGRAAFPDKAAEQTIYLLAGVAHKQSGNIVEARRWLQKAVTVNADTDTAEKARTLLLDL